jgi:hypothetical protein
MSGESKLINWDGYELYWFLFQGTRRDLPRREARISYKDLMEKKPERKRLLKSLVEQNGLELGTDNESIQRLDDWFRNSVEEDPERPRFLWPDWYSVSIDIGLFLGDIMIERNPGLHWEFFTWGKKNISYQKPVIMGFDTPDSKYNIEPERRIVEYGHSIVNNSVRRTDVFVLMLNVADETVAEHGVQKDS